MPKIRIQSIESYQNEIKIYVRNLRRNIRTKIKRTKMIHIEKIIYYFIQFFFRFFLQQLNFNKT